MKNRNIILALVIPAVLSCAAAAPKVIAHRGYWDAPGSAENSIRSLVKADSIGCYGSEFDVWMTKDGQLVIHHDAAINGVSIEGNTADVVRREKIPNGETIPTLNEYLRAAQPLNIRLVLEMKPHDSRSREFAAVKKVLELVKQYGLEERTDYISFSPEAFRNFINLAPKGTKVYYLCKDYIPAQISFMGGAGIDYEMNNMRRHAEWIEQCHDLGLEVNIWTVSDPDNISWCIDHGADYITTNAPELVQKMIVNRPSDQLAAEEEAARKE